MVSGHSYMPCDRDFGNIEKHLKVREVFTPTQYGQQIKICRKKNPFNVILMTRENFKDFSVLQSHITKRKVQAQNFLKVEFLYFPIN